MLQMSMLFLPRPRQEVTFDIFHLAIVCADWHLLQCPAHHGLTLQSTLDLPYNNYHNLPYLLTANSRHATD